MKKKISCALLALLLAGQVMGAVSVEAGETKTTYTAVERLAPQFEEIGGLEDEGILTVKKGNKWGFVDITGKTIIDYKYDYASEMVDGVAVVGYLSEKEPYVDKETGESYEYYILYIVDKTGKETQLFITEEQNYRYSPGDDYWAHDENGNFIVEASRDELDDIFIHDGVIRVVDHFDFIYRYDGTPIYIKDTEKLDALLEDNWNGFGSGWADYYVYFKGNDGLIPMRVSTIVDQSPVSIVIDLDGNIVYSYPMMDRGDITAEYKEGTIPYDLKNTPEEYGVSYTYAPENGYVVAYNSHFNVYSHIKGDETVYNNGYGVMNADGEWVIDPVYTHIRTDYDKPINDGYVSLKNQDGYWGMMNVEGEIVFPFEYYAISPMTNGYALLYKEKGITGVITDANGQAYTITDANGNTLDVDTLYTTNADNNVRMITTTDGKTYLLSGTHDGTTFKAIEGTENMGVTGWRSMSGQYWTTKTDAGYGVIEIVIEETPVEETKPAETETTVEEKIDEKVDETETTEEVAEETTSTTPVANKHFPIRGSSAAKQFRRSSLSGKGLSPMVRH